MDLLTISFRLFMALLFGAILGVEREMRRRPAGLRTYMLVCVGAALVMITNELLALQYPVIDPSRMGAQVISGIGFLGAGTIIVTGKNKVQGLTTAAGLWATACVGLTVGAGFVETAAIGCLMVFIVVVIIYRVDDKITTASKIMDVYIEFDNIPSMRSFIKNMRQYNMRIYNMEIIKNHNAFDKEVCLLATLRLKEKKTYDSIITLISDLPGVIYAERV